MKNLLKIISLSFLVVFTVLSCSKDDLAKLNEDGKHSSKLPSETLLSMGQQQFFYYTFTPNVNFNNFRFFTQHIVETTYFDESRYDLGRNQPRNNWDRMYVYSLNNFAQAKKNLAEESISDPAIVDNMWATLEIAELVTWEHIVDTYGDVPYFEALNANEDNFAPQYDDARSVYDDLVARIDAVVGKIDTSKPGYPDGDLVYHGDMDKWRKVANSLKFRLAMNLADVDEATSKTWATAALSAGIIDSDEDAYSLKFAGGTFNNPVYDDFVASGRRDFVASLVIIDLMNDREDPRRDVWFTTVGGEYIGGTPGVGNPFASFSQYTDFFLAPDAEANLLSYEEILLLKVEAAARGGYGIDDPAGQYAEAVSTSMTLNGVSEEDIQSYLAANPYDSANWKESIGAEAYTALFNRAFASWNFIRRLDYPVLENPESSVADGVPVRMIYSDQEYLLNDSNVSAAAQAIGGDNLITKLFWDKY